MTIMPFALRVGRPAITRETSFDQALLHIVVDHQATALVLPKVNVGEMNKYGVAFSVSTGNGTKSSRTDDISITLQRRKLNSGSVVAVAGIRTATATPAVKESGSSQGTGSREHARTAFGLAAGAMAHLPVDS